VCPKGEKAYQRNEFQELKRLILPTLKQTLTAVQTMFRFYDNNALILITLYKLTHIFEGAFIYSTYFIYFD
jgi:hypothetical protein